MQRVIRAAREWSRVRVDLDDRRAGSRGDVGKLRRRMDQRGSSDGKKDVCGTGRSGCCSQVIRIQEFTEPDNIRPHQAATLTANRWQLKCLLAVRREVSRFETALFQLVRRRLIRIRAILIRFRFILRQVTVLKTDIAPDIAMQFDCVAIPRELM